MLIVSKSLHLFTSSVLAFPRLVKINNKFHLYNNYFKWQSEQFHPSYNYKTNFSNNFYNNPSKILRYHVPKQSWAVIGHRRKASGKADNIMKTLLGPPKKNPPNKIGEIALASSALTGLGALCFYGLWISKDSSMKRVEVWHHNVRDRIKTTYAYLGGSLLCTTGATFLAFRSQFIMRMMNGNAFIVLGASLACQIVSGIVVINSAYYPGFGFKQIAWIVHSSIMGLAIAPVCFIGGPVIVKAFSLTAGILGGLSTIAYCAPEGQFLSWSAPLAICLGCICTSTIGSFFLPPATTIGTGLFAVYLYGGLVVFSLMLMFDTQTIIKQAELTPYDDPYGFDPINSALSLYMDALNVFVRFVQILALQEVKKRQDK